LLALGGLWVGYQTAVASDVSPLGILGDPLARYLRTRGGAVWELKLLLLALLLVGFLRVPLRPLGVVGLVLAGGFLFATSLTSHAAAFPRAPELVTFIDWLHQLAAGAWLGSLVATLVLLPEALRTRPPERAALLAALVPRLSVLAMVSVGLLVLTGVFGALIQVGRPEAFGTIYGISLLVKIGGLAPMLLVAALNLLVFKPRLAAGVHSAVQARGEQVLQLARRFGLAVAAEVLLGVGILFATGVLTAAEPARDVWMREPKPVDEMARAEDLSVRLQIAPGRVGQNHFTITPRDGTGPASEVQRVQMRFTYLDQALGRGTRIAEPAGGNTYVIESSDLSAAGRWQVDVAIRRMDREDTLAAYLVDVGVPTGPNNGSAIPLPALQGSAASWGLALLLAALLGLGWTLGSAALKRGYRPGLTLFFSLAMMTSVAMVVGAADFSTDYLSLRNPVPVTPASLERGKEIYFASGCPTCHGDEGRGDGPMGLVLQPRPADFRIHMAAGHTDGQLFDWISNGYPASAMPAFRDTIPEQDRWYLINFIRTFAGDE
jgi:copper transport protein